ncbi:MAG: PEP-CTERM sorting domain-containing protein [Phycisphaerales bacterium]|nr:PEP-CTERM sorting domain-containing protein [Phycisphaerales bacterium]
MFSLKHHIRRHATIVAVGAASLGLAAASQAAIDWTGDVSLDDPDSQVILDNDVTIDSLTFNASGCSIKNAEGNSYGITVGPNDYNRTFVTQTGDSNTLNTINTTLAIGFQNGNSCRYTLDIQAGTLYVQKLTPSSNLGSNPYVGYFQKTGAGLLSLGALSGSPAVEVLEGKLLFSGTDNSVRQFLGIGSSSEAIATLAGNATINVSGGNRGAPTEIIPVYGHLAPGDVTADSNFGATGALVFQAGYGGGASIDVHFQSTSSFDIDLETPDIYDSLSLICGNYSSVGLSVYEGATININDMSNGGDLSGIYHIISLTGGGPDLNGGYRYRTISYFDADGNEVTNIDYTNVFDLFTLGKVPDGYTYKFKFVGADMAYDGITFDGIDLIVTKVPEPASLGLLTLGSGLLLLRRKNRS